MNDKWRIINGKWTQHWRVESDVAEADLSEL